MKLFTRTNFLNLIFMRQRLRTGFACALRARLTQGIFDIGNMRLSLSSCTRWITRGNGIINRLMLSASLLFVTPRAEHIGQIFLRVAVQHCEQTIGQMTEQYIMAGLSYCLMEVHIRF